MKRAVSIRFVLTTLATGAAIFAERGHGVAAQHSSPEYAQHAAALGKLTVAVAEAMPPVQYDFRPDPPSMSFGEQMSHIAQTNYGYWRRLERCHSASVSAGHRKGSHHQVSA
jgi:hypothetical protein